MTTRAELEEVNDELQVRVEQLEAALEESVARDEYERVNGRLSETEAERDHLRETVRNHELRRQNELLEIQEARRRLEELREMDLRRLGEESRKLAGEREEMAQERTLLEEERATERELLERELQKARREAEQARTQAEGWKNQSQEIFRRMQDTEQQARAGELKIRSLEATNHGLKLALEEAANRPPRTAGAEMLHQLAENTGPIVAACVLASLMVVAFYVASWIWTWLRP